MYVQKKRNALLTLGLMLAFVLACSAFGDESEKANKLVGEANAAITEGNKLQTEAAAKGTKATAQAAVDAFSKRAEKYREASKKFDEASKLKIGDPFKEYLTAKSQEVGKRAEMMEVAKKSSQLTLESGDPQATLAKALEYKEQMEKLEKEATELKAKADKIQSENKDKIK